MIAEFLQKRATFSVGLSLRIKTHVDLILVWRLAVYPWDRTDKN